MEDSGITVSVQEQRRAAEVLAVLLASPLPSAIWTIYYWPRLSGQVAAGPEGRAEVAAWAGHLGVTVTEDRAPDGTLRVYANAEADGIPVEVWSEIEPSTVARP